MEKLRIRAARAADEHLGGEVEQPHPHPGEVHQGPGGGGEPGAQIAQSHAYIAAEKEQQSQGESPEGGQGKALHGVAGQLGEIEQGEGGETVQCPQMPDQNQSGGGRAPPEYQAEGKPLRAQSCHADQVEGLRPAEGGHPRRVPPVQHQQEQVGQQSECQGGGHEMPVGLPAVGEHEEKAQPHRQVLEWHVPPRAGGEQVQGQKGGVENSLRSQKPPPPHLRKRSNSRCSQRSPYFMQTRKNASPTAPMRAMTQ